MNDADEAERNYSDRTAAVMCDRSGPLGADRQIPKTIAFSVFFLSLSFYSFISGGFCQDK